MQIGIRRYRERDERAGIERPGKTKSVGCSSKGSGRAAVDEAITGGGTTLPAVSRLDDQQERKAPTFTVKSTRGKPLNVSIEPIEFTRLMSAFGTAEPGFANLMLGNIVNGACDGGSARPPGEEDINRALAAVSGIGARDETVQIQSDDSVRALEGGPACSNEPIRWESSVCF
jgi:hypothetical protein